MNLLTFSTEPETTKDMLISALSDEFPQNLNKLRNYLSKHYKKSISYQGIYKELNQLIEKGAVLKENKEYILNKEWILNINKYSENVYLKYEHKIKHTIDKVLKLKEEGDALTLTFNSYYEVDKFFIDLLMDFNKHFEETEPILMHYKNNWWPFLYNKEEFEFMHSLKSKIYTLCITSSEVDVWACDFERSLGLNVKIIDKKTPLWMFYLFGPLVINHISEGKTSHKIRDYFRENKRLNSMNLSPLLELLHTPEKIKVIFIRNSSIRNGLLEEINENFNNG